MKERERETLWGLPLKSAGDLAVPLVKVLALLHISVARLGFSSHSLCTSVVSVDG